MKLKNKENANRLNQENYLFHFCQIKTLKKFHKKAGNILVVLQQKIVLIDCLYNNYIFSKGELKKRNIINDPCSQVAQISIIKIIIIILETINKVIVF